MTRKEKIVLLYKSGATLEAIGKVFGISKQRVWQILKNHSCNRRGKLAGKVNPREAEKITYEKLKKKGYDVKCQGYSEEFDLLINDKLRVEVKHRRGKNKAYVLFHYLDGVRSDVHVLLVGKLGKHLTYIIPSREFNGGKSLSLPVNPKVNTKIQRKFKENWGIIREELDFLEENS